MEITFVSSLTPADERRLAAALFKSFGLMLDMAPIAYSLRIKTMSGRTFERTHAPSESGDLPTSSGDRTNPQSLDLQVAARAPSLGV